MRIFPFLLLALCLASGASAQTRTPVSEAMDALRTGDWDGAASAARQGGQVAADIVTWHRLRAGRGEASEVRAFLARNPDWPGMDYLRKQSEGAFSGASSDWILEFFDGQPAQTAQGALIYSDVLQRGGELGAAQAGIVLAWRTLPMGTQEQAEFILNYGDILAPHHEARLDMALWRGWEENAERMLPLVGEDWQALARARIALRGMRPGVDSLIEAVPARLRDHPGLAYERFQWRARKGRDADAIEVLLEHSKAGTLDEPGEWAGWRRALVRSQMREGRHEQAYEIAWTHGLTEGSAYADLEWLSGYLALRFLDRPDLALGHFLKFEKAVETPISMGRAGYWIGRALEALGDDEAAAKAYAGGGQFQTSFYGLLAAEKAGMPPDPALAGGEAFPDWRQASFTQSSVHRAAMLFLEAGELTLAERFWTHLAESQDRTGMGQLGRMAIELDQPHLAVMLGKRFAQAGIEIPGPYYALHPLAKRDLPVAPEMALAIARRESEFDPAVISHAGARGLMQLMPGTARQVSAALELEYDVSKLITDPVYNARLGSAYLAGLSRQFGGNVVMVSAGYNAGPSRPVRWMKDLGDPRSGERDVVDWIEHVPFSETRNYIMRVAESLPVYRARLGKAPHPVPFSEELVGGTLSVPDAPID
ncbi:soluble lytic murein transglycosylase [Salinihabitans flavidus]|uniref:Soluble lytic murein transglycosylase n=1 Tax=Salinihabitans flavidus TaxID=569882 RepID=A0A1H8QX24_9RHOB|nr:lytic transglycosylase domain-containing protein [Salinihabitans flavidus]SEO58715.1 soluble lytic murein transglycosylase [Salinihabitans flavidus]